MDELKARAADPNRQYTLDKINSTNNLIDYDAQQANSKQLIIMDLEKNILQVSYSM